MGLFRYPYWFPSNSILMLADAKKSFARHALERHEKNISNYVKASHPFFASMSVQQAGQVLTKSNKSSYPIDSFEQRYFKQKHISSFEA